MTAKCYVCGSEDDLVYYEKVILQKKGWVFVVPLEKVCICKKKECQECIMESEKK